MDQRRDQRIQRDRWRLWQVVATGREGVLRRTETNQDRDGDEHTERRLEEAHRCWCTVMLNLSQSALCRSGELGGDEEAHAVKLFLSRSKDPTRG